jgi:hypothetical protein
LWCAPRPRSKLDLISFRHPAEQREDVLEGEGCISTERPLLASSAITTA